MAAVVVILAVFVVVVTALLLGWYNSRTRQLLDKIPGPPALPFLGNALSIKPGAHDFFQQILNFCRDFNPDGGIMRLWLGPSPVVLVSKASTIESLMNSSTHITKSREYDLLKPWLATGLLTSTGEKWKVRRKLLTPTFHFKILADFLEVFNEQSRIMVQKLEEKATGQKFDIFPVVTLCALDIICETAMGRNVDAQSKSDSEYVDAVRRIAEIVQQRMKMPHWRPDFVFNNTKLGKIHNECVRILQDFTRKVIEERSADLDSQIANRTSKVTMEDLQTDKPFLIGKQKRLAFLDMLLVAAKSGSGLTHSDIQEEVDTFMFEGHDTTAAASNWAVFLLGHHPDIQERVRDELRTIFADDPDRNITMDDIKEMKYLDRVVKEALRVYPSVPMIGRQISEDCVIGGYTVPKGASAMIIIAELHNDPKYFPDPAKFDPDRWLSENSQGRHPYCYIPFSAGHRNCIGQRFAVNEEKVILASIFRKFTVTSCESRAQVKALGELIQRPEDGVIVTLKNNPI